MLANRCLGTQAISESGHASEAPADPSEARVREKFPSDRIRDMPRADGRRQLGPLGIAEREFRNSGVYDQINRDFATYDS
jgi:hypothetical protein